MFGKSGWIKILVKKVWRMNGSAKSSLIVTRVWWITDDSPNSPNLPPSNILTIQYNLTALIEYLTFITVNWFVYLNQSFMKAGHGSWVDTCLSSPALGYATEISLFTFNNPVANLAILLLLHNEQVNNNCVTRAHTQT